MLGGCEQIRFLDLAKWAFFAFLNGNCAALLHKDMGGFEDVGAECHHVGGKRYISIQRKCTILA